MALAVLAVAAHLLRVPQFAGGRFADHRRSAGAAAASSWRLAPVAPSAGLNETGSMRSRSYSGSNFAYSFGPGPVTPAVKALLIINIGVFVLQQVVRELPLWFGLQPVGRR